MSGERDEAQTFFCDLSKNSAHPGQVGGKLPRLQMGRHIWDKPAPTAQGKTESESSSELQTKAP